MGIRVTHEKLFARGCREVDQGAMRAGALHAADLDDVAVVKRKLVPDNGSAARMRGHGDDVNRPSAEPPEWKSQEHRSGDVGEDWRTTRLSMSDQHGGEMAILRIPLPPYARFDESVSADALPSAGPKLRCNCSPRHPVQLLVDMLECCSDSAEMVGLVHRDSEVDMTGHEAISIGTWDKSRGGEGRAALWTELQRRRRAEPLLVCRDPREKRGCGEGLGERVGDRRVSGGRAANGGGRAGGRPPGTARRSVTGRPGTPASRSRAPTTRARRTGSRGSCR